MGQYSSDRELGLRVQWKQWQSDPKKPRVRSDLDTIVESHQLSKDTEWFLSPFRDMNIRKSQFIKGSKGRVQEIWTEGDKLTAPTELRSKPTSTGFYYLSLLGAKYKQSGKTHPYLKYCNTTDRTFIEVAKLTEYEGSVLIEELPSCTYIPECDYPDLGNFLIQPIRECLGYYASIECPILFESAYIHSPLIELYLKDMKLNDKDTMFPVIGTDIWIERDIATNNYSIYTHSMDLKGYVRNWLTVHPVANSMSRKPVQGTRKIERTKDARDRKYAKGKRYR